VTIPTTAKATTEIPANTPKPIGSTSNFFPGGSEVVGAPAPSAVGVEDRGKRDDEGGGKETVVGPVLSGCGVEDVPTTAAGTPGGGGGEELAGGKSVAVGSGRTVLEEMPGLGGTSVEVEESVSVVLVEVGDEVKVVDGSSVDTVELDAGGGRALEASLPLSGVTTQLFSSLTMSIPFTTVGVKTIVHV